MFTIRRATLEDMETLIQLRIALLQASGNIQNEAEKETVAQANRAYFVRTLPTGGFLAWVAEVDSQIVGCGGLIFLERPPMNGNLAGQEAYILNIYTLPAWRAQGVATALFQTILAFLKEAGIKRIWLHASEAGRRIYEKHGFTATHTEMEFLW
jgi:ribosomal protein S18 acetylase RimI-like enzyme